MAGGIDEREGGRQRRGDGDGGPSLLDRLFGSLAHPHRRCVLYYLREEGQAELGEVADAVVSWEGTGGSDGPSTETRERIQAELRHVHLPKLDDDGLVEFDHRSNSVYYSYPPAVLDDILDLASTVEAPP